MNVYELLFIIQLLAVIAITLVKFYNVMSVGTFYDGRWSWLLFVAFMIFWAVGFVTQMLQPTELIYVVINWIERFMLMLNVLFLIIEMFYIIKERYFSAAEAYKANELKAVTDSLRT